MIFRQALQRELSRTFIATLLVLVTIVMTMMLIRTLGLASKGSINPQEVLLMMAYSVMGHAPTILTLSLFITLVSTLARMMGDSEMVIWLSSGKSLLSFLRPLFTFSAPILVTIAVMVLIVWPWANSQMQGLRDRFERRGDLERIAPGEFQESANGKRVYYIDKGVTASSDLSNSRNVFIANFENGKESVTVAQSGHTELQDGHKFIVLNNGQRVEFDPIKGDIKLIEFEVMGSRVDASSGLEQTSPPNNRSTKDLVLEHKKDDLGELAWRLGLIFAAINFVLLSLAMSNNNPRSGRGGHLMLAMLTFIVYYNLINVSQNWIASGRFDIFSALGLLHGGAFILSLTWLLWRQYRP
jgi:lipopolysaccharide export system permease protein